jgi:hypothetical protein
MRSRWITRLQTGRGKGAGGKIRATVQHRPKFLISVVVLKGRLSQIHAAIAMVNMNIA